ncbi:MAG: hypothetical protein IVW54_00530 [Candidatus Binataceae bacterium]|nr:hypothetical protein [Candidatus Binataceae bacterium]
MLSSIALLGTAQLSWAVLQTTQRGKIVAPKEGKTVSGNVQVTVRADRTFIKSAALYRDSGDYIGASTAVPFRFQWNSVSTNNGTHHLFVKLMNRRQVVVGTPAVDVNVSNAAGAGGNVFFSTQAPHAQLPSGAVCANEVPYSSFEPRPQNATANQTVPSTAALNSHNFYSQPLYSGSVPASDFSLVDGNYTGTTDMIIQWAACKWGLDEDVFRAIAANESWWKQSTAGDHRYSQSQCERQYWNGWNGNSCYQSYGLTQVKVYDFNAWPEANTSTSFNVDFIGAYIRACMNGDSSNLDGQVNNATGNTYPNGSTNEVFWGCVGGWYSGQWYDSGAQNYISNVQALLDSKPWLKPGF